ncbi:MAG: RNA polymerase sigma factor [Prevotella sp.]|nr:RNA polymerase sigma factor [Prevotella sp.]
MFKHTAVNSEEELCKRIKANDKSAIKELYTAYIGFLSAVCYRYITDKDDAKDILQNSILKIITKINTFEYRGDGSLKAWMTKILVNEIFDFIKHKEKSNIFSCDTDIPDMEDEYTPQTEDIPPALIQEILKQMPLGYRTVFNMYVFEQKSHKQIAKVLGIKESSSASQYLRAKRLLAKRIKEYKEKRKEENK